MYKTVWRAVSNRAGQGTIVSVPGSQRHFPAAPLPNKKRRRKKISSVFYMPVKSDGPLHLVGTEASGTSVHMAGSSVNDSLNALDVGLPCTIGTSVGVGDLDTEGYALATKITLSHSLHLPSGCFLNKLRLYRRLIMIPDFSQKCKHFFRFFSFF